MNKHIMALSLQSRIIFHSIGNEPLTHAVMWMTPKPAILNERSQFKKSTHCMSPHT